MKTHSVRFAVVAALLAIAAPVTAQAQTWANWSLPSSCSGNVSGAFGTGSVSFSGNYAGVQNSAGSDCGTISQNGGGDNYFNPTGPYNPTPDNISFIQLINSSQGTITFSAPVLNPYLALVSVGQNGLAVTYSFNDPFTVLSNNGVGNPAYWGTGSYSVVGNSLVSNEFSGVLQFSGSFTSISFSTAPGENWHGFTVGAPTAVPEPSSFLLMASGLIGMGFMARRRRKI